MKFQVVSVCLLSIVDAIRGGTTQVVNERSDKLSNKAEQDGRDRDAVIGHAFIEDHVSVIGS